MNSLTRHAPVVQPNTVTPTPGEHLVSDILAFMHDSRDDTIAPSDYVPGWDAPSYATTREEDAYAAGWLVGFHREPGMLSSHSPGWTREVGAKFIAGRTEGEKAREAARRIEAERVEMESVYADPEYQAWSDEFHRSQQQSAMDDPGYGPIRDEDAWPLGCVS